MVPLSSRRNVAAMWSVVRHRSEGLALHLPETGDRGADRDGRGGREDPGPTSDGLPAALGAALPNPCGPPLHRVLSAEGALVLRVLLNQDLLHELTQGCAIAGTVLTDDSYLLRALRHLSKVTMVRRRSSG